MVGGVSRPSSLLTVSAVGNCNEPAISKWYPSKSSTVEAIPPAYSLASRHRVRPARCRMTAAARPFVATPITIASKSDSVMWTRPHRPSVHPCISGRLKCICASLGNTCFVNWTKQVRSGCRIRGSRARCGTTVPARRACGRCRASTAPWRRTPRRDTARGHRQLQLGIGQIGEHLRMRAVHAQLNRPGELGLDLPDVTHDAIGIHLLGPQRGDLGDRVTVVREREDRGAHGRDDGFVVRTGQQCRAEPLQSGVVIGEQRSCLEAKCR